MALGGCGIACKIILIILNLIFSGLGFVLFVFGMWMRFSDDTKTFFNVEELQSSAFVVGVNTLIAIGSILLILSLFGHYGACKESRLALKLFLCLVAIVATAEVVVGVNAFSDIDEIGKRLIETYSELYALYVKSEDRAIAATLTFIHNLFYCCGLTGIPIIEIVQQTCPKTSSMFHTLPSCPNVIPGAYDSWIAPMMILFFATGFFLITAGICGIVLMSKIRASMTPQYVILTNSAPVVVAPHLYPQIVSSSHPDNNAVVFTTITTPQA